METCCPGACPAEDVDGQARQPIGGSAHHLCEMLVEGDAAIDSVGPGKGHGDGQYGVRADPRFCRGPVERDHGLVEITLIFEEATGERGLKLSANIRRRATTA